MKTYEIMYVVRPDLQEEEYKKISQKYENIITKQAGKIIQTEMWGHKVLAYEIKNHNKGFYILTKFSSNKEAIYELDRLIRIDESVLRHMIIS